MTRSVKDSEISIRSAKVPCSQFDSYTTFSFFFCFIHNVCKFKPSLIINFCLLQIFTYLLLFDNSTQMKKMSRHSTFSTVNVSDNDQVKIIFVAFDAFLFFITIFLKVGYFRINLIQLFKVINLFYSNFSLFNFTLTKLCLFRFLQLCISCSFISSLSFFGSLEFLFFLHFDVSFST